MSRVHPYVRVLLLLCAFASAYADPLPSLIYRGSLNPDGRISTKYLEGNGPPAAASLSCNAPAFVAGLPATLNLPQNSAFSADVRQYFTGTDVGSAIYSIVTIAGTNATTNGWGLSGNNLTNAGTNLGAGTLAVRGTYSGGAVDCPSTTWSIIVGPGGTDNTAPTIPTGTKVVLNPLNKPVITWDQGSDPKLSTQPVSGRLRYQVERGGSALANVATTPGLSAQFTDHIIGTYTSAGDASVQAGATRTLTGSGDVLVGTTDKGLFLSAAQPGNWTFIVNPTGMTGSTANAGRKACIGARTDQLTGAPTYALCVTPTQIRAQYRTAPTTTRVNGAVVTTTSIPQFLRLSRAGNTFTSDYSANGQNWTNLEARDVAAVGPTPEVFMTVSSLEDGVPVIVPFAQVNLTQDGTISYTDTTAVASTTYTYTVKNRDIAGNVSSASLGASITTDPTTIPNPNVRLYENWETGAIDSDKWVVPLSQIGGAGDQAVVGTQHHKGTKSIEFTLTHPGVIDSKIDEHAELKSKNLFIDRGVTACIGFALLLPNPYVNDSLNEIYFQTHQESVPDGDQQGPPFQIYSVGNTWRAQFKWRVTTNPVTPNNDSDPLGAWTPGTWQDFIIKVKNDPVDGTARVWTKKEGQTWPADFTDATSTAWSDTPNSKTFALHVGGLGFARPPTADSSWIPKGHMYKSPWKSHMPQAGVTVRKIYMDDYRRADGTDCMALVDPDQTESVSGFNGDPGITGSGTFTDGQTVTVTKAGGGFGTKPNGAKARYIWDFGHGDTTTNALSRTSAPAPQPGGPGASVTITGSTASWGVAHFDNTFDMYYGNGANGVHLDMGGAATGRDLYNFLKYRWGFNGTELYALNTNYNIKEFRFWPGHASGANNTELGAMGQSIDINGDWRYTMENTSPGADAMQSAGSAYLGLDKNVWKVRENEFRQSSADDVADASVWLANRGKIRANGNNGAFCSRNTGQGGPQRYLYWWQPQSSAGAIGRFDIDLVYIDDSFARIVITNQATWDDTVEHEVEIQFPIAWSDTQLQFQLRKGEMASLTGKWAWAIKSDRTRVRLGQL